MKSSNRSNFSKKRKEKSMKKKSEERGKEQKNERKSFGEKRGLRKKKGRGKGNTMNQTRLKFHCQNLQMTLPQVLLTTLRLLLQILGKLIVIQKKMSSPLMDALIQKT